MRNGKRTVLSLSNDSYKQYLLLRFVKNSADPKWRRLSVVPEDLITPWIWIQLHNYARADVESRGGRVTGYEMVDERLIRHDNIRSEYWPTNWMWVISKKEF